MQYKRCEMGEAVDRLLGFQGGERAYAVPFAEVRAALIAALDERLQERVGTIKLVGHRAREAGITEIRDFADVVPLLLPHTAYKSYPESFLAERKWDRLTRWLGTVSSYPGDNVDLDGVADVDSWIDRLATAGHFVSCTSGTTGKPAMLVGSQFDMDWAGRDNVAGYAWGSGVKPAQDRLIFGVAAMAQFPRGEAISRALEQAFQVPGTQRFAYPAPPITIGSITKMITLRKAIAEGAAKPSEITEFEATSAARQKAMDDAVGVTADALIAARKEKLFISGMWAALYPVAAEVRNRGYGAKDFNPENTCYVAGGLKGAVLPPDYREYIYETFNLRPERNYQIYGMQEIGSVMPRCQKGGRYHLPPWLICLPLDKDGDKLAAPLGEGVVEGRAAFFDLSVDGRWGGIISGDRIEIDYRPCECGARSPSIRDNIARYSDIAGDDKIACSGTIDAYVRGLG
jgi:hypothetical protein